MTAFTGGVLDGINPLLHPICLTKPLHLPPSAWYGHIPFGMWLISVLRPKTYVELGTHYGCSYCALCQAKAAIGYEASFYAVDTWQGDHNTGSYPESVYDQLRSHHDPRYGSFSQLLRIRFDEAASRFPEGSIDLLHIDGAHDYAAVRRDWDTWLPKMSDRGVILLHDITERRELFEVWSLWNEIKPNYPHFEFNHSYGLGIVGVGKSLPIELEQLFQLPADAAATVQALFEVLGTVYSLQYEHGIERQQLLGRIAEEQSQLADTRATLSWRITKPLRTVSSFYRNRLEKKK